MEKNILIVGGYGSVGSAIAAQLCIKYPGLVTIAGRSIEKAKALAVKLDQKIIPASIDVSLVSENSALLNNTSLVIMCLDLENLDFVKICLSKGIDYVDISANYNITSQIEELDSEARKNGSTVVLSTGLAPGISNLLVKHCQSKTNNMDSANIFILLGLGESHGEAAIRWTIDNLHNDFDIYENCSLKRVKSFQDPIKVLFPSEIKKRKTFRYNFSDQHVLPRTLNIKSVSTRICFESTFLTGLLALFRLIGISKLLTKGRIKEKVVQLFKRFHMGTSLFSIKVEASVGDASQSKLVYECSIRGEGEGRITGLIAAVTGDLLLSSNHSPGVYHIEQLFKLSDFLSNLTSFDVRFEEGYIE